MRRVFVFGWALALSVSVSAIAGPDPNYTLRVGDPDSNRCTIGSSAVVPVLLDFANGSAVAGASFGVCHDPEVLAINCVGGQPNDCVENDIIVVGADLAGSNGGTGPQFFAPAVAQTPLAGYTCGIVINLLGGDSLAPADNAELARATYRCMGLGASSLETCETGNPIVLLSVGIAGGGDVTPMSLPNSIEVVEGPPLYTLVQGSGVCSEGDTIGIPTSLRFDPAAPDAAGVSYGVCHDPAIVTINCVGGQPNDCTQNNIIVQGSDLMATNGGNGASFFAPATAMTPDPGYTVGIVVDLLGGAFLPNTGTAEIAVATYRCLVEGTTDLAICQTGNPVVLLSVGVAGGGDELPASENGTLEVVGVPPVTFTFSAPNAGGQIIGYDPETGVGAGDVVLQIRQEDNGNPGFPNDTQGFSYGLRHNENVFIEDAGVPPVQDRGIRPAPIVAALNGGSGPDFYGPNAAAANGPGHTLGVVYNLLGGASLQFPVTTDVVIVTYNTVPDTMIGNLEGRNVPLVWGTVDDPLGDPPVLPGVVISGPNEPVIGFEDGRIALMPETVNDFVRGDCNDDGIVNIADGIWILNFLNQGGRMGTCAEACDVNDDGMGLPGGDLSDAIYIINYRFLDGPVPPAPFPDCGTVPDQEPEDCEEYNSC